MKLIAYGWQYKVFDLENGRVRKIKLSGLVQYFKILSQLPFQFFKTYKEQQRVNQMEKEANNYILLILAPAIQPLLGNPIFIDESNYEQDKVTIVEEIFKNSSFDQQKQVIEEYIDLIYKTWKYGFSDCVFNFTVNNGVDKDGKVIQLDFGEITTEKEKVTSMIQNKRWLKSFSYRILSEDLKEYYSKIMSERLNYSELNRLWACELK